MTWRRRDVAAIVVLSVALVGLLAGVCGFGYSLQHAGEGPERVFPLTGDGPLTDEQVLSMAKQVMVLDGRYKPSLELQDAGGAPSEPSTYVSRGSDWRYTTVTWHQPDPHLYWYVRLYRTDGQVSGRSQPSH